MFGVMRRGVSGLCVAAGWWMVACGGGGTPKAAAPSPDFTISVAPPALNLAQGSTSAAVVVSVAGQNGFSNPVEVTLTGLPAGVTANPAGAMSIVAGQSANVLLGADASAGTGQFSVLAQGASGSLMHTATVSLSVVAGAAANLPRTTFVRNDSVPALELPAGEPHRRHIVYDAAGQRFFVANRGMNRVEVYAASGIPTMTATIDAPGASSVDLSADGMTLWVGTLTEQILRVDLGSMQVKARYAVAPFGEAPAAMFSRPEEVVAMSNGNFVVRMRQAAGSESALALWSPASDTVTDLTAVAPAIFASGAGAMARTGDGTRLLVAANDSSGGVAVLDGMGRLVLGPASVGTGGISFVAANVDGSRYAVVLESPDGPQAILLDANLNIVGTYGSALLTSLVFARDGQTLFVGENPGGAPKISVFSTTSLEKAGEIADVAVQGVASVMEDVDTSRLLCAVSNRGVAFLDGAALTASLGAGAPVFAAAPAASPSEGPSTGGTAVSLAGLNFAGTAQIRFGTQNPVSASVASAAQLQAKTPADALSGPVNVTAYFSNGWVALAPDAFSFGPEIERVLPNAGSEAGGDTITLIGSGFGGAAGKVAVTIGGKAATVQKVERLPAFAAAVGLDASYPFALERITLTTPAGAAGKADIVVTAPSGTAMASKAFQFVTASETFPVAGLHKFLLYDEARQKIYLSATDHIDDFDLQTLTFGTPLSPYPGGPPPDAGLRGMSLTPDDSQLIVADFGGQSIYLLDPDKGASSSVQVVVGGVPGFVNSGPARVAATDAASVFVGLDEEGGGASGCGACLGQVNTGGSAMPAYAPAPQDEVTSVVGAPLMAADAKGDAVYFSFGDFAAGPLASWNATTPNTFVLSGTQSVATDLALAGDANVFAVRANGATEIRGSSFTMIGAPATTELENVPGRTEVPGAVLHPSGALLYEPFLDGPAPAAPTSAGIRGGVDIRDAHNGQLRLRIYLPEPFAMLSTDVDGLHGGFLTTDENGARLFAVTTSGLSVVTLASVPLGIGSLTPASGAAAGGAKLTLRGSGFQSATQVMIGGKAASVTFTDMNTLAIVAPAVSAGPQRVVVTNPDGESVALDAAFLAQ